MEEENWMGEMKREFRKLHNYAARLERHITERETQGEQILMAHATATAGYNDSDYVRGWWGGSGPMPEVVKEYEIVKTSDFIKERRRIFASATRGAGGKL